MMKRLFLFFLLFMSIFPICSKTRIKDVRLNDSLSLLFPKSLATSIGSVSLPITIGSWVLRSEDRNFSRRLEDKYISSKLRWYDTPLALSPLIVTYGLKTLGVESRNSWDRMLTAHITGGATAFGVCSIIKHLASVRRPDRAATTSFPSAQSVMAFTSASMLDMEYGHISPWIPVGGYAIASTTSMLQVNHGRHWIGDVLNGFTLGNVATRFGYALTDAVFKTTVSRYVDVPFLANMKNEKPSFWGYYSQVSIRFGSYDTSYGKNLAFKSGFGSGVEGAWFWNNHWGIGARGGICSFLPKIDGEVQNYNLDFWESHIGVYYSTHLTSRWLLGCHFMEGIRSIYSGKNDLNANGADYPTQYYSTFGLSIDLRCKHKVSLRACVDYDCHTLDFNQNGITMGLTTAYRFQK